MSDIISIMTDQLISAAYEEKENAREKPDKDKTEEKKK